MPEMPKAETVERIRNYSEKYRRKTGLCKSTVDGVAEAVIMGLAKNLDDLKKPLCPCNYYPDKVAEAKNRYWICPCEEMRKYKYCHCMLYVAEDNMPVTEYLPEDHEGRQMYGLHKDPKKNG